MPGSMSMSAIVSASSSRSSWAMSMGRGLLVGESAHLLHFVLDGCLEFLELDIGVGSS